MNNQEETYQQNFKNLCMNALELFINYEKLNKGKKNQAFL